MKLITNYWSFQIWGKRIHFNKSSTRYDKIYLYAKDLCKAKYQFLINKQQSTGLKHFDESTALIENSNNMDDIFENIEKYNPDKKQKKRK